MVACYVLGYRLEHMVCYFFLGSCRCNRKRTAGQDDKPEPNKGPNLNQTFTSMSALGLDVHGKDPVSDEEQSSDEESEVSDAGSEAMAGRRARIRRVEDEDDDDNTDQPDELEPWVEPEEKVRKGLWATNGGSACDENDTSGLDNQTAGANANVNAGDSVAAPSTSQMQTDGTEPITQTSKPSRSKGDKTKGEKKKKDKKEGSSRPKQPKPKAPKPKPVEEKDEADVTKVDEDDTKSKVKRPGGYVNHERVKTGGSERVSSHV